MDHVGWNSKLGVPDDTSQRRGVAGIENSGKSVPTTG